MTRKNTGRTETERKSRLFAGRNPENRQGEAMIDMHVHILPGVDDGSVSEVMTHDMLRRAREAGVTSIICTPHVYDPRDQDFNRKPFLRTREIAHRYGLALSMGCEFNYRAILKAGTAQLTNFRLGSTRCLLLEFGNEYLMPGWEGVVSELMDNGYLPIIAHPERYLYIQRDFGIAQAMSDLGCEMQVDAGGLLARPLSAERKTARRLLCEGLVSYVASDAHRPEHYDTFERAYRTFRGEWPRENRLSAALRALREERKA